MLFWQYLIQEGDKSQIATKKQVALEWIAEHLPWLFSEEVDTSSNETTVYANFDWDRMWPIWRKNFEALHWLAKKRKRPPKPHGSADHLPHWVSDAVDEVLQEVLVVLKSDYLSDGVGVLLTDAKGNGAVRFADFGQPDDVTTLWQAVFVSYFRPEWCWSVCVCELCGNPLPRTEKQGKNSRQRYCATCRVRKWREENPERARKQGQEQKRREREATKSSARQRERTRRRKNS